LQPADLLRIYRRKEDILVAYEHLAAHVIQTDSDLYTESCEETLRDRWLCCPKHRLLMLQRILLNGWLHHTLNEWEPYQEYDAEPDQIYLAPPPQEETQSYLTDILQRTFTPREWLQTRFSRLYQGEQEGWELPTHTCQRKHHINLLCCPFHASL